MSLFKNKTLVINGGTSSLEMVEMTELSSYGTLWDESIHSYLRWRFFITYLGHSAMGQNMIWIKYAGIYVLLILLAFIIAGISSAKLQDQYFGKTNTKAMKGVAILAVMLCHLK